MSDNIKNNEKFYLKNNKFNIDYFSKLICPTDRTDTFQNNKYKAFIFAHILGSMYKHKTIHNYKTKEVRERISLLMNIGERSYSRYLKESFEHGFVYQDKSNKSILRIRGMASLVDEHNNSLIGADGKCVDESQRILTFYKCKLRLPNLDFEATKMAFDVSLLRYYEYKEELKRATSIKVHIHKSFKGKQCNFLLSYEDKNLSGSRTIARAISSFYPILRESIGINRKNIESIVYENANNINDVKMVNGSPISPLVNKELYSDYLNKSLNSAVISIFDYFSLINIDSIYLGDNGSYHRGSSMGYTKSGFNSFLDRAEESTLIKRTNKYAFFTSCDYDVYKEFKNGINKYCSVNDLDEYRLIANRIIYKNGNILFQRENHIKVNTQVVKFCWDRYNYADLIKENPDISVNERYLRLTKSLDINEVDGWFTPTKRYDVVKNKSIVCLSDGKIYSSYKKINIEDSLKSTNILEELKKTGEFTVDGKTYKFLENHKKSKELVIKTYE